MHVENFIPITAADVPAGFKIYTIDHDDEFLYMDNSGKIKFTTKSSEDEVMFSVAETDETIYSDQYGDGFYALLADDDEDAVWVQGNPLYICI